MSNISLSMSRGAKSTVISNRFIDELMPAANGAFVKVYIYLLRLISDSSNISLSLIAEHLDETEKDIRRALRYWEEAGVLNVKYDTFGQITDIVILNPDLGQEREKPASIIKLHAETAEVVPEPAEETAAATHVTVDSVVIPSAPLVAPENRPTYSISQVSMMMKDEELSTLVKNLEQRIHRTINATDIQYILFYYECLGFGPALINYLYEYCSSKGKLTNQYIEKVALGWAQNGIRTAEDASAHCAIHSSSITTVMHAFGLNRNVTPVESNYIGKWFSDYGFTSELVVEACNRAVLKTNKPDFKYADSILESWNKKGIRTLADVAAEDSAYSKTSVKSFAKARPVQTNNSFNAFSQRNYSDAEMDEIEEMLLNKKQG